MSYPLSTYVAQIAVAANGNPSITVRERAPGWLQHPAFPPVTVPGSEFPTAIAAEPYAEAILRQAGVLSPAQQQLVWVSSGHTLVNGRRYAARTAAIADAR